MSMFFLFLSLLLVPSLSTEEQSSDKSDILSYTVLETPFRMKKVNLLWEKARRSLSEGKLQQLYSELKLQDKEESTLKRLRAEKGDKDGSFEAAVRKRLNGIINKFGLSRYGEGDRGDLGKGQSEDEEGRASKNLYFKDKRLNRLWEKAEKAGLTDEEMMALKIEFRHHQEKVEQYNDLLEARAALDKHDPRFNAISLNDEDDVGAEKDSRGHDNELDGKAKEIKDEYGRLHRMATNTQPKEFEEEKAQALWKLAQEADFSPEELNSLRQELHHFETRVLKMHYLEAELRMADARRDDPGDDDHEHEVREDSEGRRIMNKNLRKHAETVEKLQGHLERTIAARHSEL